MNNEDFAREKLMKNILLAVSAVFILLSAAFSMAGDAESFSPWTIEGTSGKKAPEFSVKDLSGKEVSLSSFGGKPVLLNFWATWCPYCREERPYLNALYKEYKGKGLTVVAVSTDRSPEKVKEYLKNVPLDFVILHDDKKEAATLYGVHALPVTFFIDRKGVIRHKVMGFKDWTDSSSRKLVEKLLED